MRNLDCELQSRIVDPNRLISYGFMKKNSHYEYRCNLSEEKFQIVIDYFNQHMTSKMIDIEANEEYLLVDIETASGEFIGKLRAEYQSKLTDIWNQCSNTDVFKSESAKNVIAYIEHQYHDKLEFLWVKSPNTAIIRHQENKKWYGAIMTISKRKLGLDSDDLVEIIDLKNTPDGILTLVNHQTYFPGYHMNKTHWFTIKLDGSVPNERLIELIDISYQMK